MSIDAHAPAAANQSMHAQLLERTGGQVDRLVVVVESPPSVVSRRSDAAVGGRSPSMDVKIDRLARDVTFLIDQGILADASKRPALELPSDVAGAEVLAAQARHLMGVTDGPLYDLQRARERVGLLAFSLQLGEEGGDGAYVEVGNRAWP